MEYIIHINLLWFWNFWAGFSEQYFNIFTQFSNIGTKFWMIFTWYILISKNGWIRKFVYFHFELCWHFKKLFCVFEQILPNIFKNARKLKVILAIHFCLMVTLMSLVIFFDNCKYQNKNGLHKTSYKIFSYQVIRIKT